MAETEYPSTPLRLLLCDARALVAQYTKTEPSAEQLLLDFYAEAKTPYGYQYQSADREFAEPGSRPGRGIDPGTWRGSAWTRRLGKRVVVDWQNNMVTEFRTAPDLDDSPRPDLLVKALQLMREFSPVEPVYQIRLVRLHTRDVFAALRWAGLLPPLPIEAPALTKVPPVPPHLHGTERWVYEQMRDNPPRKGERGYTRKLWERRPDKDIKFKTFSNLVSKYRKQFEKPAGGAV